MALPSFMLLLKTEGCEVASRWMDLLPLPGRRNYSIPTMRLAQRFF